MAQVIFINPATGKPIAPLDENSYPAKALSVAGWQVQEPEPDPVVEPEPEPSEKPEPEPLARKPKAHKE